MRVCRGSIACPVAVLNCQAAAGISKDPLRAVGRCRGDISLFLRAFPASLGGN